MAQSSDDRLDRREAVAYLLEERGDLLVVSGLGAPTYDTAAAGDEELDFYLWGAMGSAATIGLGLALAQPRRRVLVLTGDGEMLMGLGALATIGAQRPDNLTIAVLDNESYGETGGQESHTAEGVVLPAVALGCGFPETHLVSDRLSLEQLREAIHHEPGPHFAAIKIAREEAPRVLPSRDGVWLKHRFRRALLGVDP